MAEAVGMEVEYANGNGIDPLADGMVRDGSVSGGPLELKCIMKCTIDWNQPVIPLSCLHFICSDGCAERFKAGFATGASLVCPVCNFVIALEELDARMVPAEVFVRKPEGSSLDLICENCVWNRVAIAYCQECPAALCHHCKVLHPQTRATQTHVIIDDVSEQKKKQLEKLGQLEDYEEEAKCEYHQLALTLYCESCDLKSCRECQSLHEGHTFFDMEAEREVLKSNVEMARKLMTICDKAVVDIESKRQEILTTEWDGITTHINDQFEALIRVLLKREMDLQLEARERFMRQLGALNMRNSCAELARGVSTRFVALGEDILYNRADFASIKFLREYQTLLSWLSSMDSKFTQQYDRYIDRGWHFNLDVDASAKADIEKQLSEYCLVKYSYKPTPVSQGKQNSSAGVSASASTSAQSHATPSTSFAHPTTENNLVEGRRGPSRRIAVKSTASSQLSAKILQRTVSTYSSQDERLKTHKKLLPQETKREIDLDNPQSQEVTVKSPRLRGRPPSNIGQSATAGINLAGLTAIQKQMRAAAMEAEREARELSISVARNKLQYATDANPSTEKVAIQESINTSMESATENTTDSLTEEAVDTAISAPGTSRPSSKSTRLGAGKRERKKKSFPEFVDTDESLKFFARQNTVPEPELPPRRTRGKSSKVSSTLQPPQKQEPEDRVELNEDVINLNDGNNFNLDEVESAPEYESSDGYGSESGPSERRLSLRKRTPNPNDAPGSVPRMRRPRRISINYDDLPEAPIESVETLSDAIDFPVQGMAPMKITDIDQNEDYCAVCLDGGNETIVCCDFCPKVFHLSCHAPALVDIPMEDWRCNFDTTKEGIEECIADFPYVEGSEKLDLVESNQRHFIVACKFIMECYKIAEIPTMRFVFPDGYNTLFGKIPFHLKYIRERLTLSTPEPFKGVEDMLRAYRQMFMQAFRYYKRPRPLFQKRAATTCFNTFMQLIDQYYPHYRDLFADVLPE